MNLLFMIFITMGGIALSDAVQKAGYWSSTVNLVFIIILIIIAIVWFIREFIKVYLRKQPQLTNTEDERTGAIRDKSARNALFVSYLGFYIKLGILNDNSMGANWIFYMLGSSLVVLLVSYAFYYYRKS